jgi:hypothetical protein
MLYSANQKTRHKGCTGYESRLQRSESYSWKFFFELCPIYPDNRPHPGDKYLQKSGNKLPFTCLGITCRLGYLFYISIAALPLHAIDIQFSDDELDCIQALDIFDRVKNDAVFASQIKSLRLHSGRNDMLGVLLRTWFRNLDLLSVP